MPRDLREFVLNLETQVWEAVCARDGESLRRLFSTDYIEVTFDGLRTNAADIVAQSPVVDEINSYEISEVQVVPTGPHAALVSYHLRIDGKCRGKTITPPERWATSVWRKNPIEHVDPVGRNGVDRWICCFHQQGAYRKANAE